MPGANSMMIDFDEDGGQCVPGTDSSPAKSIMERRGAGRIRHLHCLVLWSQDRVASARNHFISSAPPEKRLVNRFERGAVLGESGVIEAPRSEEWGLGFVFLRHLVQVDCVTVKFTSATVMSEVFANVSDGIYMFHVAMGLKKALAFRAVVEMVSLIPRERVADRQPRPARAHHHADTSCTRTTNSSTTATTSPEIKHMAPASATAVVDFVDRLLQMMTLLL